MNSDPRVSSLSKSPPVKEGREGSRSPVKEGREGNRSPAKERREGGRSPDRERSPSPLKQQQPEPASPAVEEDTTGEGSQRGGEGVAPKEEEKQVVRSIADAQVS